MKPHIETLIVKGFRALQKLEIKGLGQVNLITGMNNTGKSSVLEALRLLASSASPSIILDILRYREEDVRDRRESVRFVDANGPFVLSSLFHGFPQSSMGLKPIVIRSSGGRIRMDLSMETGWFYVERLPDGSSRRVLRQLSLLDESELSPALVIVSNNNERLIPFESLSGNRWRWSTPSSSGQQLNCVFVSPYGGEQTGNLGLLWDKIALSDREEDLVEALRVIDPEIEAISMVGGEAPRSIRTAIVRAKGFPRPVPLRSYGDGLNRLFGIVLSLVNAKDGLLLIDEFENGMHHTVQLDVWRAIFRLARQLDIQVVATSHSWDAIEAFQKASCEVPDEGVLVRLSRKGSEIIPTLFREDELAIATRDRIEVR